MPQTIVTRYKGPTNTRGSRVIATAQCGRMVLSWDHRLNSEGNHRAAAEAFAAQWGWDGILLGGTLPDGHSYAWILGGAL